MPLEEREREAFVGAALDRLHRLLFLPGDLTYPMTYSYPSLTYSQRVPQRPFLSESAAGTILTVRATPSPKAPTLTARSPGQICLRISRPQGPVPPASPGPCSTIVC